MAGMHTSRTPAGTVFIHNGDFSGAVLFTAPAADGTGPVDVAAPFQAFAQAVLDRTGGDADADGEVTVTARLDPIRGTTNVDAVRDVVVVVPFTDVQALVAERVSREVIAWAEEADDTELISHGRSTHITRWAEAEPDWR